MTPSHKYVGGMVATDKKAAGKSKSVKPRFPGVVGWSNPVRPNQHLGQPTHPVHQSAKKPREPVKSLDQEQRKLA